MCVYCATRKRRLQAVSQDEVHRQDKILGGRSDIGGWRQSRNPCIAGKIGSVEREEVRESLGHHKSHKTSVVNLNPHHAK
jgi:hypothetical protein